MPSIKHYFAIQAPAEKVYEAITEQDGLAAWWTQRRDDRSIRSQQLG
jgi:uncharacterized protein YndB with AHSA1/START domain